MTIKKIRNTFVSIFILIFSVSCTEESISSGCISTASISDQSTKDNDNSTLSKLLKEITDLADSKTCGEAKSWKTSPIGEKPCGGPSGYIAYSTEIDVDCFLKKVTYYTEQTKKYNKKHGLISDCMVAPEPKGVKCENGKPVLVFN